jgi:hypothetical protein
MTSLWYVGTLNTPWARYSSLRLLRHRCPVQGVKYREHGLEESIEAQDVTSNVLSLFIFQPRC